MAPSQRSSSGAAQLRWVNPRVIVVTCALVLTRSVKVAGARQLSSDASSSSLFGASTSSMSGRELARMIIERDEKVISVLKARQESLYDEYCPRGLDGVRRPTDRVLQFIVPPTSQHEERPPVAPGDDVTPQGAAASPLQERAAPFKERKLILEAFRSQQRRIAANTVFKSKRTQELERLRTTVVYPYMLIRVRMPDGALLQARFHPDEAASAVVDCIQGAMDKGLLEAGGFELLSLGSAKRMVLSSDGDRTEGFLATTLQGCGLIPPAATLIFKWKKGKGGDRYSDRGTASEAWVREGVAVCHGQGDETGGLPPGILLTTGVARRHLQRNTVSRYLDGDPPSATEGIHDCAATT